VLEGDEGRTTVAVLEREGAEGVGRQSLQSNDNYGKQELRLSLNQYQQASSNPYRYTHLPRAYISKLELGFEILATIGGSSNIGPAKGRIRQFIDGGRRQAGRPGRLGSSRQLHGNQRVEDLEGEKWWIWI
jgi:hypothetical protein